MVALLLVPPHFWSGDEGCTNMDPQPNYHFWVHQKKRYGVNQLPSIEKSQGAALQLSFLENFVEAHLLIFLELSARSGCESLRFEVVVRPSTKAEILDTPTYSKIISLRVCSSLLRLEQLFQELPRAKKFPNKFPSAPSSHT